MDNDKKKLPKKAFDHEYSTPRWKEMEYLKERGIECSYVKTSNKYGVTVYKYTKTPELFRAVADFYELLRNEKAFNEIDALIKKSEPVTAEDVVFIPTRFFGIVEKEDKEDDCVYLDGDMSHG